MQHNKINPLPGEDLPNPEWHYRQVLRLVERNIKAMERLTIGQHLTLDIIKRFGLGLTPPSKSRDFTDALSFPVMNANGQFAAHYLYSNLSNVTSWQSGIPPRDSWGTNCKRRLKSAAGSCV